MPGLRLLHLVVLRRLFPEYPPRWGIEPTAPVPRPAATLFNEKGSALQPSETSDCWRAPSVMQGLREVQGA